MASLIALLTIVILAITYVIKQRLGRAQLPPGPPRLPLIDNLHQITSKSSWTVFKRWVEEYGPLVSADFGGTVVIIIGDYEIARELLDKRSHVHSYRPRMVMVSELLCKNKHILFVS
ncbi:hypothetical protein N0V91_005209 [Didymella pomorum]|uniref:Cytochrome P450 n=1 Tax=Didymella pomorum TaxID=749634 RepID=A0A9W8ZFQ2_9PLEO|nr:hypothetical protein N0V91_005209 [Didymella pomorum]